MPGNYAQYHELASATSLPLIAGERMAGKMQFEQLLESRTVKYVMFDITWCGGLTEARKIAAMADAFELPICPHTAGGRCCSTRRRISLPHRLTCGSRKAASDSMSATGRRCSKIHRAGERIHPRSGRSGVRHAHQTGSLESPSAVRQVSGR